MSKAAISNVDSKWPLLKLERKKESEGMCTVPVSVLPVSYLQPFFGSEVQCRANSQILATAADFQCFFDEHLTPPEWVYLPRD